MKTVFKYAIGLTDKATLDVPAGAEWIHVAWQNSRLCVWGIVESDNEKVSIDFFVVGTGHPMPERPVAHIGSVLDGPFVWHVFTRETM